MKKSGKMLGVVGGMGPMATELFYKMIIEKTLARCDQDHLDMIILNHASTPDRTKAILEGREEELFSILLDNALFLQSAGADFIAIPCNTSHFLLDRLQKEMDIPIINMIAETARRVASMYKKGAKVAILATEGTVRMGLYQQACEAAGLVPYVPEDNIRALVMKLIYEGIKEGNPIDLNDFRLIEEDIKGAGCVCGILGCTELSVFRIEQRLSSYYVDAMEILAETALIKCGKEIKKNVI